MSDRRWCGMSRACGFAIAASLASGAHAGAGPGRGDGDGARAAAAEEIVELRYSAPPGCPTREAAIELIRERTPAVRFVAGAHRVFEVRVAAGERGYTGSLVVDATAAKQLAAARCDDLVTALALVIALAIDPTAAAAAAHEPAAADASAAATGAAATGAAATGAGATAATGATTTATAAAAPPRAWTLDGAIAGAVGAGVTPDPLLAGAIAVRASRQRFAAELALVAGRDSTRTADARASFTRVVARPAACRLVTRRRLELGGCGHAELGLVHATGDDIINGRALVRLWAAVGAHGVLRWPAPPSRGFAQLQLGLAVPVTRDRYRFMPGIVIYETAPATGWLGLGLGLRFP
jgi:hypothetical protein